METHHIRRTTLDHLSFEEMVINAGQFDPIPKNAIYRLVDALLNTRLVSCQDFRVLKEILSASGDNHLCTCSNRTLALRLGFSDVCQVSRAIRRLRDAGFLTVKDSGNCKREGGFGISVAILHIRYDELHNKVQWLREEEKQRTREQRLYQTAKRRILTIIKFNDLSEDIAHALYEAAEMAKAVIHAAKQCSSAVFAQATAMIQKSISKVLSTLNQSSNASDCIENLTYVHDNSSIHLPITTLKTSSISNKKSESANADSHNQDAAKSSEEVRNKEHCDFRPLVNQDQKQSYVSLEMIMAACPTIKPFLQSPVNNWSDLINQSGSMARMCGVNDSAVQEGIHTLGKQKFAVAMAIVLHKSQIEDEAKRINKPGGYIRGMIAKATRGQLNLERSIYGLLSEQKA